MKITLLAAPVSLLVFYGCSFFSAALTAGGTWRAGAGEGIFWATLFALAIFPSTAAAGFLFRLIYERLFRRRLPYRNVLPWFAHLPLSLPLLFVCLLPVSPQQRFQHYIADDVPRSLSDFQFWRESGFGNGTAVLSFKIDPAEFSKVLARHHYLENPGVDTNQSDLGHLAAAYKDFSIVLPNSPIMDDYSYSDPSQDGGYHVHIYTTPNHDRVIAVISYG